MYGGQGFLEGRPVFLVQRLCFSLKYQFFNETIFALRSCVYKDSPVVVLWLQLTVVKNATDRKNGSAI